MLAKEFIKARTRNILAKLLGEDVYTSSGQNIRDGYYPSFICPICGAGNGEEGKDVGITTSNGLQYRCCGSGCLDFNDKAGKDVFDLYKIKRKIPMNTRFSIVLEEMYEEFKDLPPDEPLLKSKVEPQTQTLAHTQTVVHLHPVTEDDFENDKETFSIEKIISFYFPDEKLIEIEERKEICFSDCEEIPEDEIIQPSLAGFEEIPEEDEKDKEKEHCNKRLQCSPFEDDIEF